MANNKGIPVAANISVTLIVAVLLTVLSVLLVNYLQKPFEVSCTDVTPLPCNPPNCAYQPPVCSPQFESIGGIAPEVVFFSSLMTVGVLFYLIGLLSSRVPILGSSLLVTSLGIVSHGVIRYWGELGEVFRMVVIFVIAIVVLLTALFKFVIKVK